MLTPFGEGIWIAAGPQVVAAAGFHYPTRAALIRLADGGLLVWSPVHLTDALRAAVSALGPVTQIVAPNSLHHLAVPEWQAAWPRARAFAAPGLRAKRPDIPVAAEIGEPFPAEWSGLLDCVLFRGNRITTEAVFFHRPSGTAIFTDLLQQFPQGWFTGWRSLVARLDLMTGSVATVPRKFRLAQRDRAAGRRAWAVIRDWPVRQVLMAHGSPVTEGARQVLADAFRWLE